MQHKMFRVIPGFVTGNLPGKADVAVVLSRFPSSVSGGADGERASERAGLFQIQGHENESGSIPADLSAHLLKLPTWLIRTIRSTYGVESSEIGNT